VDILFASETEKAEFWLPLLQRALPQDRFFVGEERSCDVALLATPPAGTLAIYSAAPDKAVNDSDGDPLDGAAVWITTAQTGGTVIAGKLYSSAFGIVTFMLEAGTYWVQAQCAGKNFTPYQITVS